MVNVIQCLQILLEEKTEELDSTLRNTASRLSELKPDDERDHLKVWEIRDNVRAIWEDPAIKVCCCAYFMYL